MNDAGLDDRVRPDVADGCGQSFQSVTHEHEDVLDSPVPDLGQDLLPELRSFAGLGVLSGPEPQDVAFPLDRDTNRNVNRPVDDLSVPDLDHQGIDKDHRIDAVQGLVLPFDHLSDHRVSDPRHLVLAGTGAVDLGEVRRDLHRWSNLLP
ncbi:hypothetical protein JCM9957A_58280 [Kineosporia succinea]